MRRVLIFLPVVLWAQTPTPKTSPAQPAQSQPAAAASTAPKPAAAKAASPSVVKRPAPAPKPMTDEEKIIYALGLSMYRSLGQFDLSAAELDLLKKALTDAAAGKPAEDIQTWGPKIQELASSRAARAAGKQKALSAAFLSKAAGEAGAQKTESGMVYRELHPGAGESPKATDTVKVNYRGTLVDGTEFDSSYKRGEPAQFPLNGVIKCWTEGVQKMKVGGKSQLVCPADLAYGDGGRPGIPGGATLVFEIELLQIGAGPGK
jgi:FKBP-type peptidyl-prolyl cis-trans isomerase FkpA